MPMEGGRKGKGEEGENNFAFGGEEKKKVTITRP